MLIKNTMHLLKLYLPHAVITDDEYLESQLAENMAKEQQQRDEMDRVREDLYLEEQEEAERQKEMVSTPQQTLLSEGELLLLPASSTIIVCG